MKKLAAKEESEKELWKLFKESLPFFMGNSQGGDHFNIYR